MSVLSLPKRYYGYVVGVNINQKTKNAEKKHKNSVSSDT
jgi:hypothetical protein